MYLQQQHNDSNITPTNKIIRDTIILNSRLNPKNGLIY